MKKPRSKMHNMNRMRDVNKACRRWLFDEFKADYVWLKQHTRFSKDIVIGSAAKYDGFCIRNKISFFLQIKSNRFPPVEPYMDAYQKHGINSLLIRYKKGGKIEYKIIGGGVK